MNTVKQENINDTLRDHQVSLKDWDHRKIISELHIWAERFILEFKLQTRTPAIKIEHLRSRAYGHNRHGRNGFGFQHEIAHNKDYLGTRTYGEILGTHLHELLHAEQEQVGKPGKYNYHNKEFRQRAAELGLIIDQAGHTTYASAPTPFLAILEKHGVSVQDIPDFKEATEENSQALEGSSKLKLWECQCKPKPIKVRVAIKDFEAICLKCNGLYVRKY